jgi:O-antigen biosynthesis protein
MLIFILGGIRERDLLYTAEQASAVFPESQVYKLRHSYASMINAVLSQRDEVPWFMTVSAGTSLGSAFRIDFDKALWELCDLSTGWISFVCSEWSSKDFSGNAVASAPIHLWNRSCLREGRMEGFAGRSMLPFDSLLLEDRQLEAMRHGWRGKSVASRNWKPPATTPPSWRKLEKEYELIYPLLIIRKPETLSASPAVSVILCTYNDSAYLPWAIRSVLAQTCPEWELLIIDDGSTDHTRDAIATFLTDSRIRYLRQESNRGKATCLNLGLKESRGAWILELDADDWLAPDCLETMLKVVGDSEAETALWHSRYHQWTERANGELVYKGVAAAASVWDIDELLERALPLAPRFYSKKALQHIGGWSVTDPTQGRLYEDFEIIARLAGSYSISFVDRALYHQRLRMYSMTRRHQHLYDAWRSWMIDSREKS